MQLFWDAVIEPLLDAVRPRTIVEIGSDQGHNTLNLLGFCRRTGATLHVVDPSVGYEVSEWQSEYEGHFVFHNDLSLDVLPEIEDFDLVLIDGDHNWYTVFNELKTIERLCHERTRGFPLVLLHDIGWPYGRRDLYYDPETIPEEYRKPFAKKGMLPGVDDLVEEGGMNRHLNNALREHESGGGVLTAVEAFMGETRYDLDLLELPGIHGLGVLCPASLKESNPDLAHLLDELDLPPLVARYVQAIEDARLELQVHQQEQRGEHARRAREAGLELRARLRAERKEQEQRLAELRQRLAEESHRLREERHRLRETRHELALANQNVLRLTRWLESLDGGISVLLRSRQWRVGSAVGGLYRRATFKGGGAAVDEHLKNVLREFRTWRAGEGRNRGTGGKAGE